MLNIPARKTFDKPISAVKGSAYYTIRYSIGGATTAFNMRPAMISKNPPIKLGVVFAATIKNVIFGGMEFALSSVMRKIITAAIQNI